MERIFSFTVHHWACQTSHLTFAPLSNISPRVPHLIIPMNLLPFFLKISPRASWVACHRAVPSSHHPLVFSSCRIVVTSPLVRHPLVAPPSRHLIAPAGVASPLVTPPSRPLVAPPSRPFVILLLHHPLIISLRRLVVVSPLVAPPSRPAVAPPSRPFVVLSLRRPLFISSRRLVDVWRPTNKVFTSAPNVGVMFWKARCYLLVWYLKSCFSRFVIFLNSQKSNAKFSNRRCDY